MNGNDEEKEKPVNPSGIEPDGEEKPEALENRPSDEPVPEEQIPPHESIESARSTADESTVTQTPSPRLSQEEQATNELSRTESGETHEEPTRESPAPDEEAVPALRHGEARGAVEAVLYAASEPLSPQDLRKILPEVGTEEIKQCLQELLELYHGEGRGLQIVEVAGGYQITTRPEFHERVSTLFHFKPPSKLSIQALETLATIAYRQPITVPEIQELRGVRSTSVIRTLLEKRLIRISGRKKVVGRPLLYGTTKEFLLRFGLKDLGELPRLEDMSEVFGEDMALQLEGFGGVEGPSTTEDGDEYPSGIVSADPPVDVSNGDAVPSETETEKSEELPFDDESNLPGDGDRE